MEPLRSAPDPGERPRFAGRFSIRPDDWLGGFLDRKAYRVHVLTQGEEGSLPGECLDLPGAQSFLAQAGLFAYARVPAGRVDQASLLESLGFGIVETSLVFEKPLAGANGREACGSVRNARPGDRESVMDHRRPGLRLQPLPS